MNMASHSLTREHAPAGIPVHEDDDLDESAAKLLSLITAMATGQTTTAERNGQREIAIWKRDVTL
jgi:altronate hydrolase